MTINLSKETQARIEFMEDAGAVTGKVPFMEHMQEYINYLKNDHDVEAAILFVEGKTGYELLTHKGEQETMEILLRYVCNKMNVVAVPTELFEGMDGLIDELVDSEDEEHDEHAGNYDKDKLDG